MTPLNRLPYLVNLMRRPLRIRLVGPPDQAAAALQGIAHLVLRRRDMNGRRIRIHITIRTRPSGGDR
ncbi:hypothetical protein [Micromonospora vulcania]|uniref:Uncharacterized protein n=1 Tax=Micromonospora vulcania TaxID=1441873 RepID=A0ABW1H7A1_9ACTN